METNLQHRGVLGMKWGVYIYHKHQVIASKNKRRENSK